MKTMFSGLRQGLKRRKADAFAETSPSGQLGHVLDKLDGRDRIGVLSEGVAVAGSAVAGAAASGVAAGAAGATTLLGSTALAGAFGGVFVTATPVGWVIGSAAVAGIAGLGLVKLIRSGVHQDSVRTRYRQILGNRLAGLENSVSTVSALDELLGRAVAEGVLAQAKADALALHVAEGRLQKLIAMERVNALIGTQRESQSS